jgi:hypothetical protein
MRSSTLLLAALLVSACTHAPAPTPSTPPIPTASAIGDPGEPPPPPAVPMAIVADPKTSVMVMEADDLGGGLDTIVAPPKRPSLPSMMTDIAMAPSR